MLGIQQDMQRLFSDTGSEKLCKPHFELHPRAGIQVWDGEKYPKQNRFDCKYGGLS